MILDLATLRYLLLLTFLLAGCAAQVPTGTPSDSLRQGDKLQQLQLEQQSLSLQVSALQEQLRQLEAQVQTHQDVIAGISPRTTEMVIQGGQKTEVTAPATPPEGTGTAGRTATDIYLKAFSDYAAGRFSEAIQGFRDFLELYPGNDFSGNAQFWLGECYYSQRLLSKALAEFSLAAERYPDGTKAADALLKMSRIYSELNQPDKQRQTEDRLLELYPQSSAGKQLRSSRSH
jgi:tol-pal system protein YbgF